MKKGFSSSKRCGEEETEVFYFYTEDQPDNGPHQVNSLCQPYESVPQPCNVDAILVKYEGQLWKLTRYYNKYGTRYYNKYGTRYTPNTQNGNAAAPSTQQGELYNLENDPLELNNLIAEPEYLEFFNYLSDVLSDKSFLYRGYR